MARDDDPDGPPAYRPRTRFHGRTARAEPCAHDGCAEPGEFRAPPDTRGARPSDKPPAWRWLCLDHVRAFNARYNYFNGMSPDEIEAEQRPFAGWERETRAFSSAGGAGRPPRWADFTDPLDAIGARFRRATEAPRADGRPLSESNRRALGVLGLAADVDRRALRKRYAELLRRYHPDRNGGDRSHEAALQEVIAAYTSLKAAKAFA